MNEKKSKQKGTKLKELTTTKIEEVKKEYGDIVDDIVEYYSESLHEGTDFKIQQTINDDSLALIADLILFRDVCQDHREEQDNIKEVI